MKTKPKQIFKSESALQEYAVQQLKRIDTDIPIYANPHSSQRNIANKGMSQRQRMLYFNKIKKNNKSQGFQEGQSDLTAIYPTANYHGLATELKTVKEDPFREYRSTGKTWLEMTSDLEKSNHIIKQLDFLWRMRKMGFCAYLCAGMEQFDVVYEHFLRGTALQELGYTEKVYNFMNEYYEKRSITYLSKL